MNLPILTATLQTDRPVQGAAALLRGFFGHRQPESLLLHHHYPSGEAERFAYMYPRVQYRIRDGVAQVVGVAEGMTAVAEATRDLAWLELAGWRYRVAGIECQEDEIELVETACPQEYIFAAPWLALNQKNHDSYQHAHSRERNALLERILIGNVLSMSKSLGIRVIERLRARVAVQSIPVHVKKQVLLGFIGRFSINFRLASGLGLGHLVSIGFGEIRSVGNDESSQASSSSTVVGDS